jgi:hypothetical protein
MENGMAGGSPDTKAQQKQRRQQMLANYNQNIAPNLSQTTRSGLVTDKDKLQFARRGTQKGQLGYEIDQLQRIRDENPTYSQPEDQLRDYTLGELGGLKKGLDLRSGEVDYQRGQTRGNLGSADYQRGQTRDFRDTVDYQRGGAAANAREGNVDFERGGADTRIAAGRAGMDYQRGETDFGPEVDYRRGDTDLREGTVDYKRDKSDMQTRLEERAFSNLGAGALNESPMLAQLSSYTRDRLGVGLTDEEMAAIRGPQIEATEAQAAESKRTMANDFAASGMDPRAASAAMGRVENSRMANRAGIERDLVLQRLQAQRDMEQLGTNVGQQELSRLAQAEDYSARIGELGEQNRQFDVSTAEGARQADVGTLENSRQFDVGTAVNERQAIADLGERGRQFDVSTAEGARQYDTSLSEQGRQYDVGQEAGENARIAQMLEGGRQFDVGTAVNERQALADLYQRDRQFDVTTDEGRRQFDASLLEQGRQFDVGTDENARQYDVTTEQGRDQAIRNNALSLAEMANARREYDTGFVEARRQARMNRQLMNKMMRRAEPTPLENTGAIIGGIRGGLSM